MQQSEWTRIFNNEISNLEWGDDWTLTFDDSIEPDSPESGWKQYIRNTSARFACTKCRRSWPSNRVMVVFHMRLKDDNGVVKTRAFRQNCKKCNEAPMVKPLLSSENIEILMENLMKKIRIKCYGEDLGQISRPFVNVASKSPHEPKHCEACLKGKCTRNDN